MALATRCPRCDATFRVVSDQLKLRGGLVRCGGCRHVFDAIGSLSYVEETALQTPAEQPAAGRMADAVSPGAAASPRIAAPATVAGPGGRDPLAVPTLVIPEAQELGRTPADGHGAAPSGAEERRRSQRAAEGDSTTAADDPPQATRDIDLDTGLPAAEPTAAAAMADTAEPDAAFLREGQRRRGLSVAYSLGALVLTLALTAQAALLMRTDILKRWPALYPHFVEACRHYGCDVSWPARADLLAVVGTELQQLPGTELFEVSAVVRNRAQFRVALPALEVTLTDPAGRTLARKVFSAADTLRAAGEPATRLDEGIEAGADHVVRLTFEARGVRAASFVVYPFYP